MDVCSLDWGAIAGFAGAVATIGTGAIALYISNQWRKQKGSEVVANEAESLILLLNEYEEEYMTVHSSIVNKEKITLEINRLKDLALKVRRQTQFFYQLTNEEEQSILDSKKDLTNYYKKLERLQQMSFNDAIADRDGVHLAEHVGNSLKTLRTILIKYFKYQK
ncbi:hypothetical protein [Acinetobacter sp. NIPH 2699]|uniref:hypothetical protein n=1 Tax=Acinetobacter sp. NIPH 2699 TaxID=2923433 RepID=UPI001F4B3ADE|nr:hypothetical protein [Acinetobacter sp. NIPH 2699]MCH7336482.1 hypothetical protein [Acinetobacter sp. NIPH 2699]